MVSIELDDEIEQKLNILASFQDEKSNKTEIVRKAIFHTFEDHEDVKIAEDVLDRIYRGEEFVYSLDEVEHDFGLAD